MCLKNSNDILIAEKDIKVFKVMKSVASSTPETLYRSPFTLSYILTHKATGLKLGLGYHCFDILKKAKHYHALLKEIHNSGITKPTVIHLIELFIPKGSKCARGFVNKMNLGAGLQAMRTEQLTGPTKEIPCQSI
tara:strand:+ start:6978 stop:7382 length:405 start_codon:yes stop_codon:yes gene_type:complete